MDNFSSESFSVLLSLGSNLGDRIGNLKKAISMLSDSGCLFDIYLSSYYETEPYGYQEQPWFVNMALSAKCNVSPGNLLVTCKEIENLVGRKPRAKWHQREIDIDLILFGNLMINDEFLQIPHPAMHKRLFVLVPSAEILGDSIHPELGLSINELLDKCSDNSIIKKIE